MNSKALQRTDDRSCVGFHPGREISFGILRVGDAQTSTGIDITNVVSAAAKGANEGSYARHGLAEGACVNDLRADMNTYASGFQMAGGRALAIKLGGFAHGHPELVLMQASGNV